MAKKPRSQIVMVNAFSLLGIANLVNGFVIAVCLNKVYLLGSALVRWRGEWLEGRIRRCWVWGDEASPKERVKGGLPVILLTGLWLFMRPRLSGLRICRMRF